MPSRRIIPLRYQAACATCHVPLPARTRASWDAGAKTVTCLACVPHEDTEASLALPEVVAPAESTRSFDSGVAGGSATRLYERKHARRESAIREAHPRLGGLILAVTDDPNSTTAWAKGAAGERYVAERLATLAPHGVLSLHDRRIPGSKANIDHIAVGPSGVFVIDAKRYTGEVTTRSTGTFWRPGPDRLFVGRRDCTKLIKGMAPQFCAVEHALQGAEPVPIVAMLCFVNSEWGWFAKPLVIGGVWIGWSKAMADVLVRPGPFSTERVAVLAARLAERLPPA